MNIRVLGWTTVAGAILAGTVVLIHEYQMRRNVRAYVRQADKAFQAGDLHKAAYYLQQYLAHRPTDTKALIEYGLTKCKLASTPGERYQAFLLLQQAARRAPSHSQLRQEAAQTAMSLFRYSEAIAHLEFLVQRRPNDAALRSDLGWCQEGVSNFEGAEQSYRKALEADDAHLKAYRRLAYLMEFELKRPDEVMPLYQEMVRANPDSPKALLAFGNYLEARGLYEQAAEHVQRAMNLAPNQLDVILANSRLARKCNNIKAARQTLENGLAAHPQEEKLYRSLASLEIRVGRPERAIHWLRRGLQALPKSEPLMIRLAGLLVDQGPSPQAVRALEKLRGGGVQPEITECLQARLWLQEKEYLKAVAKLEKIVPKLEDSENWAAQAYFLLGQGYLRLGDFHQAIIYQKRALEKRPNWNLAHCELADAYLRAGRLDDALSVVQLIKNATSAPKQTTLLAARAVLLKNRQMAEGKRNIAEIKEAIAALTQMDNAVPEAVLLRAEAHLLYGQQDKAAKILNDARKANPQVTKYWAALADLHLAQGEIAKAKDILLAASSKFADDLDLRMAWLRYWNTRPAGTRIPNQEKLGGMREGWSKEDRVAILRALAENFYRKGDLVLARKYWRRVLEINANDLASSFSLFDLALQSGDRKAADNLLNHFKRIEGNDGVLWRYADAVVLIHFVHPLDEKTLTQARQQLAKVKSKRPQWSQALCMEGKIEELAGNKELAVKRYQEAMDAGNVPVYFLSRLAKLLYEKNRFAETGIVLAKIRKQQPLPLDLAKMAVAIALRNGDDLRAVALARKAIPGDTGDYRKHLWLASVLNRTGRKVDAENVLRALAEKSPSIPDVWIALVAHLAAMDKKKEAADLIPDFSSKLPADRVTLTLARCYEELGQAQQAETMFLKNIERFPHAFMAWRQLADFYTRAERFADAEPWLRKLTESGQRMPMEIVAPARRDLALCLAKQKSPEKYQQALEILDRYTDRHTHPSDAMIAKALVLATKSSERAKAIELLEQAESQYGLDAPAAYTLATLYQKDGNWKAAGKLLLGLLTSEGEKAEYLVAYIRNTLAEENVVSAEYYLTRLRKLYPAHSQISLLETQLQTTRQAIDAP